MANKLTKKKIDLLIEQIMNEREYVSGSRMPTQAVEGVAEDFIPPHIFSITGTIAMEDGLKKLANFCSGASIAPFGKGKNSLSDKFNRMIAIEFLHKLLNTSIPSSGMIGYDSRQSGFGLEKTFASLFGGEKISGSGATDVLFKGHQDHEFSIKFYTESSIKKFGYGQKFKTLYDWAENSKTGQILRYIIFVKSGDKENVGFKVYMTEYSKKFIQDQLDSYSQQASGTTSMDETAQIIYNAFKEKKAYKNLLKNYMTLNNIERTPATGTKRIEDSPEFRSFVLKSDELENFRKEYFSKIKTDVPLYKGTLPKPETIEKIYVVKPGDTKQTVVDKTGNTKARLNRLNSKFKKLRDDGLTPGTKIKYQVFEKPDETEKIAKDSKFPLLVKPENPLRFITELSLPRKIDDFLEISFREMSEDITELYSSLDNFKDNLVEYHKANQGTKEREKTSAAFEQLKNKYNTHIAKMIESTPPAMEENVTKKTLKNETKSKKDLDNLIKEVILNKNK